MPNFIFNFLNRLIWQSHFTSSKVPFLIENANNEFIFSDADFPIFQNCCLKKKIKRSIDTGGFFNMNPVGPTRLKKLLLNKMPLAYNSLYSTPLNLEHLTRSTVALETVS